MQKKKSRLDKTQLKGFSGRQQLCPLFFDQSKCADFAPFFTTSRRFTETLKGQINNLQPLVASTDFHVHFCTHLSQNHGHMVLNFFSCYLISSRDELITYQKEAKRFLYLVVTFRIFILIGRKVYCVIKHIRK